MSLLKSHIKKFNCLTYLKIQPKESVIIKNNLEPGGGARL